MARRSRRRFLQNGLAVVGIGLRERGWVKGEDIAIEYHRVEGDAGRLPDLAAEAVRLKPDQIVTRGSRFTEVLKEVSGL